MRGGKRTRVSGGKKSDKVFTSITPHPECECVDRVWDTEIHLPPRREVRVIFPPCVDTVPVGISSAVYVCSVSVVVDGLITSVSGWHPSRALVACLVDCNIFCHKKNHKSTDQRCKTVIQ
ncbi:hypothetical protein BaRGS_00032263 [Batillaria attramentaria]|uniref:Uncharacterized protein n=1 Tax=Batillaria attramentaria TaxID=370345 RepID=A0ABD0JP91_9CAEN